MRIDLRVASEQMEAFCNASGLGCVLSDCECKTMFESGPNYLGCTLCKKAGHASEECIESHRYGSDASMRFGGRYVYFCTMGLTFFTSPVIGEDGMIGRLTAGPLLMVDDQDYMTYDLNGVNADHFPSIMEEVQGLPHMAPQKVNAFSQLLFAISSLLSSNSETVRMIETEYSVQMQGNISDYLFHIKQKKMQPYPYREERQFLQALAKGEQNQAQELLNDLLGFIIFESGNDICLIRNRMLDLMILISRSAIEAGADSIYLERCLLQYRNRLLEADSVEVLCMDLSRVVRLVMEHLFSNAKAKHSDLIYHTVQYLTMNFERKLSLEEVAHTMRISPTYLSRVFKRETGSSMVDFLNRIRIEKSKELLADESIRLIEVALQSGFESQSYFNRIFKQVCDVTPQQYRKQLMSKEN